MWPIFCVKCCVFEFITKVFPNERIHFVHKLSICCFFDRVWQLALMLRSEQLVKAKNIHPNELND